MIRYHLRYHHAFHLIVSVTEENKDDGSSHRWCGSGRMAACTSSPLERLCTSAGVAARGHDPVLQPVI